VRRGAIAACAALALLGLTASDATADRDADSLSLAPIAPHPSAGPVRDDVLEGRPRAAARASAASASEVYVDQHGHRVTVLVSNAYGNPDAAAQDLVDFLGGLIHGDELNDLAVFLATPGQVRMECGPGALACYFPSGEEMIVPGHQGDPRQPPRELVIAHEYGHHIARNRTNRPWSALDRGTKRWSTHERICRGIDRGRIRPFRYFENPGEAFAEAYAFYRFPDAIRWQWDIARPDANAFDAILADVRSPWTRRTPVAWEGVLEQGRRRDVTMVRTPLDGRLRVELRSPPGAEFELRLLAARQNRVLDRATGSGRVQAVHYTVCGKRKLRVAVRRIDGEGPFEVEASRP
jgi:hypothetical protein